MGIYLNYAEQCLQRLKPQIEERTGIKLEDTVIKAMKDLPEKKKDETDEYKTLMAITSGRYTRQGFRTPDTIHINEESYRKMSHALEDIPITINHELSHPIHGKLINEKIKEIKSIKPKIANLLYKAWIVKRYHNSKSFREGFCEYMSLNHLANTYDKEVLKDAVLERILPSRPKLYERGYRFFQKVLSIIGKEKVFDVAKSPPISEIEMKMPSLYLLRQYPFKSIKNISRVLERGTSTEDHKNKMLYNYIVRPPPIVKKGSGKRKIVKALPAY